MAQNQKAVLMCYNIPRGVKEEILYELFCIAGPIESIQPGKSGKSLFVFYEFAEAVATAKEIFKDVKIYGRPIRMFDKDDIESIYAKQEEQNSNQHEDNYGHNNGYRRHEEFPRHSYNSQNYRSSESSRYQEKYPRESNHQRYTPYHPGNYRSSEIYSRNRNCVPTYESTEVHSEETTSRNDLSYRSDLIPSNPRPSQNRREESRYGNSLRNPYEGPVLQYNQRNSNRYEDYRNKKRDRPNDHHSQRNHPYRDHRRQRSFH